MKSRAPAGDPPRRGRRWPPEDLLLAGLLLAAALLLPPLAQAQPWQGTFATYFIAITLEAVPYILAGALLGGLVESFLPAHWLPRIAARLGVWGIPVVAALAPLAPVCECGVVGIGRGLLRKGLPHGHALAYLIAAPILNPVVLFTTWLAFRDWQHPLARGLGGWAVAVAVGWWASRRDPSRCLLPGVAPAAALHLAGARAVAPPAPIAAGAPRLAPAPRRPGWGSRLGALCGHVLDHFLELSAFFLLGVAIAATMKTLVPPAALAWLGGDWLLAPLAMMATAFLLSLCSEADAFVGASFTGFPLHAHTAFLVFGPMCDIKLLLMYRTLLRPGFLGLLVAAMAAATLAWSLAVGAVAP